MKGLLLNEEHGMWDAVLQGYKTNTRRAHKSLLPVNEKNPDDYIFIGLRKGDGTFARFQPKNGGQIIECRARYEVGMVTFLQEPTMKLHPFVTKDPMIMYRYPDKDGQTELDHFKQLIDAAKAKGAKWGNKMFMPESEARYFVKITDLAVERIEDISVRDCLAEGIKPDFGGYFYTKDGKRLFFNDAKKAYFSLYNSINLKPKQNPWVFSYHFELCTINS